MSATFRHGRVSARTGDRLRPLRAARRPGRDRRPVARALRSARHETAPRCSRRPAPTGSAPTSSAATSSAGWSWRRASTSASRSTPWRSRSRSARALGASAGILRGLDRPHREPGDRHDHGLPAVRARHGHRGGARQHGGQHRDRHRDHQSAVLCAHGAGRGQCAPRAGFVEAARLAGNGGRSRPRACTSSRTACRP